MRHWVDRIVPKSIYCIVELRIYTASVCEGLSVLFFLKSCDILKSTLLTKYLYD